MKRRDIFKLCVAGVGGVGAQFVVPERAAAQPSQKSLDWIRYSGWIGPEDDTTFAPQGGGAPVGTAPARHEEVATAFRILFNDNLRKRARDEGPLGAARYFLELKEKNAGSPPEPYNAEWSSRANPLIVAFFGMTATLPSLGDQTHWCAAFVNFCLYVAGRKGTFSALSGSFRTYGSAVNDPAPGDVVVFANPGESGAGGFGHVGFFVRRDARKIVVLGGNQGGARYGGGAVTESSFEVNDTKLIFHSFRKYNA